VTEAHTDQGICRHPYRAFFPLGWFMAWWGVLPWILFWAGSGIAYPRDMHAMIFIQGVLTPFAVGFLFTMLPRRLSAPGPKPWQITLALLLPPVHACLVWQQETGLAHLLWGLEAIMLLQFAASRVYASAGSRSGPAAFQWVPLGFLFGAVGSLVLSLAKFQPDLLSQPHQYCAWLLLTQGLFLCLVLGIGALFLPLTAHKEASVDVNLTANPRQRRLGHGLAAIGIITGFALEAYGWISIGRGLRAACILLTLIFSARMHRFPSVAGTQRKLIWIASWCLPLGLSVAALFPNLPQVGLHIFFLSGTALITFSVALHVGLAHSSGQELVGRPVLAIQLFGGLVFVALLLRIIAEFDGTHRFAWLAAGAGVFLLALLPWGLLILPRLLPDLKRSWSKR